MLQRWDKDVHLHRRDFQKICLWLQTTATQRDVGFVSLRWDIKASEVNWRRFSSSVSQKKDRRRLEQTFFPQEIGNWVELENYKVRGIKMSNLDILERFQMGLWGGGRGRGGGGGGLPGNYPRILWPRLYHSVKHHKLTPLMSATHTADFHTLELVMLIGCYDNSSGKPATFRRLLLYNNECSFNDTSSVRPRTSVKTSLLWLHALSDDRHHPGVTHGLWITAGCITAQLDFVLSLLVKRGLILSRPCGEKAEQAAIHTELYDWRYTGCSSVLSRLFCNYFLLYCNKESAVHSYLSSYAHLKLQDRNERNMSQNYHMEVY